MIRVSKLLFVGPIKYEKNPTKCHFYIMQPGGPPIRLDYANAEIATDARNGLLENEHAYAVPSMKLFDAIFGGFNDVDMLATQKHTAASPSHVAYVDGDTGGEHDDEMGGQPSDTPFIDRIFPGSSGS